MLPEGGEIWHSGVLCWLRVWLVNWKRDHRFAVRPVASSIGDIFHCCAACVLAAISDRTTLEPIGDFPTEKLLKKEVRNENTLRFVSCISFAEIAYAELPPPAELLPDLRKGGYILSSDIRRPTPIKPILIRCTSTTSRLNGNYRMKVASRPNAGEAFRTLKSCPSKRLSPANSTRTRGCHTSRHGGSLGLSGRDRRGISSLTSRERAPCESTAPNSSPLCRGSQEPRHCQSQA